MTIAWRAISASIAAATALVFLLAGAPAGADTRPEITDPPSPLALSYDGVTWHDDLPPLFAPTTVVPGDLLTRTVFVRNGADRAAALTVVAEQVEMYSTSPHPFYDELTLDVREQGAPSTAVVFPELLGTELHEGELGAAQVVALTVDLRFPRDATSGADPHPDEASFALRITLAESAVTIPSHRGQSDDADDDADDSLAGTGGTVVGLWWALAAIAIGALAVLVDTRRARSRAPAGRVSDH
ncbi:hypothetical protein [Microbacterium abyssi]|uniref:hypothetical protein n=1 Tax=Microbacterium abyssi TaxID=2782166 RepID=UPI001887CDFF|nr:hypothetical protein [Microbacterium sp. A18JL241]